MDKREVTLKGFTGAEVGSILDWLPIDAFNDGDICHVIFEDGSEMRWVFCCGEEIEDIDSTLIDG